MGIQIQKNGDDARDKKNDEGSFSFIDKEEKKDTASNHNVGSSAFTEPKSNQIAQEDEAVEQLLFSVCFSKQKKQSNQNNEFNYGSVIVFIHKYGSVSSGAKR